MAARRIAISRRAEHPDDRVDGAVMLANECQLVDRSEDHRGRALVDRVVGEQEGQRRADRRRRMRQVPVAARIVETDDADTPELGRILAHAGGRLAERSEEHTSELQSLMRISYAVFCLTKKKTKPNTTI